MCLGWAGFPSPAPLPSLRVPAPVRFNLYTARTRRPWPALSVKDGGRHIMLYCGLTFRPKLKPQSRVCWQEIGVKGAQVGGVCVTPPPPPPKGPLTGSYFSHCHVCMETLILVLTCPAHSVHRETKACVEISYQDGRGPFTYSYFEQ